MISTLFGWFWLAANLAVAYFALTSRLGWLTRSLIVGGAILGAAAGLANGLVMTVNGFRMPVDTEAGNWDGAPRLLDDPAHHERFYCRIYRGFDAPDGTWRPYGGDHDAPKMPWPRPSGAGGAETGPPPAPTLPPPPPKLAFLDDRHPMVVCGEHTLFSKGDVMGALGAMLMAPGIALLVLNLLRRKLRRD
jgi:hypothetical protein